MSGEVEDWGSNWASCVIQTVWYVESEGRPGVRKGGVYARATQCLSPPVVGDHDNELKFLS